MLSEFGIAVGGKTWHCETFTANGTWTKNAQAGDMVFVAAQAGGQAGANGVGVVGGAGGLNGPHVFGWVNVAGVSSVSITIGTGGASAAAHGTATLFGTLLRAFGTAREASQNLTTSTPGGPWYSFNYDPTNTGKAANTPGQASTQHPGCPLAAGVGGTNSTGSGGGAGSGSFYSGGGNGGNGGTTVGVAGDAAAGYGGGGGGGGGATTTPGVGGAGSPGILKVWSYW